MPLVALLPKDAPLSGTLSAVSPAAAAATGSCAVVIAVISCVELAELLRRWRLAAATKPYALSEEDMRRGDETREVARMAPNMEDSPAPAAEGDASPPLPPLSSDRPVGLPDAVELPNLPSAMLIVAALRSELLLLRPLASLPSLSADTSPSHV